MSGIGLNLHYTDCIDFFEMSTLVSKIHYGSLPLFQFVKTFDSHVWILIFLSIMILAFVSIMEKHNYSKIFDYYWNYLILMFNGSIQQLLKDTNSCMLHGVWLISAFYLAIIFTSYLLDYMIRAPPIIKIDNLVQLAERDDVKIITRMDTTLSAYAYSSDTELAKKINDKMIRYEFDDWKGLLGEIGTGLRNGSLAFSDVRLTIIYALIEFMSVEKQGENNEKLTDLLHISEENGGLEPYIIFINDESADWITPGLNDM